MILPEVDLPHKGKEPRDATPSLSVDSSPPSLFVCSQCLYGHLNHIVLFCCLT